MSTNTENIIQRIKGLMRHADSAKEMGSLAEAETFTNKVNELLLQYNLEMAEVVATADKQNDQFKNWMYSESISYKDNQSGQRWRLSLVETLCDNNLCSYTFKSGMKTFTVYGHMQNVDTVVWLYNYLSIGLLRLAQENHVALPAETKLFYNRYAYLKDFLLGAVRGLGEKMEAQRVASAQANKLTGLMVINKKALGEYLDKTNPGIKSVKFKTVEVGSGYRKGLEVGRNYSIGKPLEGNSTPEPKKLK
jgi:hypothetical protein